jgi:hypothetical protein
VDLAFVAQAGAIERPRRAVHQGDLIVFLRQGQRRADALYPGTEHNRPFHGLPVSLQPSCCAPEQRMRWSRVPGAATVPYGTTAAASRVLGKTNQQKKVCCMSQQRARRQIQASDK